MKEEEPITDGDRYRMQAEQCRAMAAKVFGQFDKDAWLQVAADWETLAETADGREKPGRMMYARTA